MRKEIMGNQNATAMPEDSKVVDLSAESSAQVDSNDKKGENQVSSAAQQTHEVSSDEPLTKSSEPPDQENEAPVHAADFTEQCSNEQLQTTDEPHHQLKSRHKIEPHNEGQDAEKLSFKDDEVGIDSTLKEKYVSQESEPLEHKQRDMFDKQPNSDATEELQKEASHTEVEPNLKEDCRVQNEATDFTEDLCEQAHRDFTDLKCDLMTEPDIVDANDHSIDTKGRSNQENGHLPELASSHCNLDNDRFSEVGQTYTIDNSTVLIEEKVERSIVEEQPICVGEVGVQDGERDFDGKPRTTVIESLNEEAENMLLPMNLPHFESGKKMETNEIQACDQRHEVLSKGHDQEFIKGKEVQVDDTNDASNVTDHFAMLACNGQDNHGDVLQMNPESTSVFKELTISHETYDLRHEDCDQGQENRHHRESIEANENNSEYSASKPEVQTDDIKCLTDNFMSLTSTVQGDSAEPSMSDGFKDTDKLASNANAAQIQPREDTYVVAQLSELDSTKPDIEGFIFTKESANGGQPTMGYLLNGTVTNFIEIPEEKGEEDFPDGESQIERCPSFKFELEKETPLEEFNQTPQLFLQGKPPMRSLSSPGNVFLSTSAANNQNGQHFLDNSVKEKTIILERNDSEKSKTPLLKFEQDEEQSCFSASKHRKQDVNGLSDGHSSKGEMREFSKGRQKQKTMSSFFSNCVCCAGVGDMNTDF